MHDLQIGRTHYRVPATWNELGRRRLLAVVHELYGGEEHRRRVRLLRLLVGCHVSVLARLAPVQLAQLLPLTDFFFDDEHLLTEQLQPDLRAGLDRLHGPRASFRNLLFGEFIYADTYFQRYVKRQDAAALDRFVGILYRVRRRSGTAPRDPRYRGDVREEFNEHRIDYYAELAGRVPLAEKLAVLTWYRGCRQQLAREFPEVFEVAEEQPAAGQAGDWGRVLRKLSGGAFGPLEATAKQHTRTLLAEMQDAAREYQRLKRQTPARS